MSCTKLFFGAFFFFFIALTSLPSPLGAVGLGVGKRKPLLELAASQQAETILSLHLVAAAQAQQFIIIASFR